MGDLVGFGGGTNLTATGPERRCHSLELSVNQGPANKDLPVTSPILLARAAGSTNRCQSLRTKISDIRLRSAKRPCIGRACKGRRRRIEEQDDRAAVRQGELWGPVAPATIWLPAAVIWQGRSVTTWSFPCLLSIQPRDLHQFATQAPGSCFALQSHWGR